MKANAGRLYEAPQRVLWLELVMDNLQREVCWRVGCSMGICGRN